MHSKVRDVPVAATAILDTGTVDNWISHEKLEEGRFETRAVDDTIGIYCGFAGIPFTPTLRVVISWHAVKAHKHRTTSFYVAPKGSKFDVIFGKRFIDGERIVLPNPNPHVFNRGIRECWYIPLFVLNQMAIFWQLTKSFQRRASMTNRPCKLQIRRMFALMICISGTYAGIATGALFPYFRSNSKSIL